MTTASVSLDLRNFAATQGDGYTNTTASNGATYCYKYSGGTDGNGNVTVTTGGGTLTITITVGQDPRYVVDSIGFNNDVGDLSWHFGETSQSATITDTDLDNENAYYNVVVKDTTANCTFSCDPGITNQPRPPM
jgi:hypothetical protein